MNAAQLLLILLVRIYRWVLSPAKAILFGPLGRCRFTPSCSEYALEAIQSRGALQGLWLSLRRLGRCHPWGECGYDPVPINRARNRNRNRNCLDENPIPMTITSKITITSTNRVSAGFQMPNPAPCGNKGC